MYRPTDRQRRDVQYLAKCGFTQREIAHGMMITTTTLRQHFDIELRTGHAKRKAEVIELLWESAKAGKVSAMWVLCCLVNEWPVRDRSTRVRSRDRYAA